MSELSRAALALGVAASLMAATSAVALDASQKAQGGDVSATTPQAVALVSGGVAAKPADDPSLPKVELAADGETRRADGAQATLDGLARDCADLGAETICKIALVGEGARRNASGPAAIDAPMTIHVKDGEGREIETRRINVKVEMPEGVQKVAFRHVEENVSLPPATAAGYGGWTIVVGLEPGESAAANIATADDAEVEQAAPAPRSKAKKRYRSVRVKAVTRARTVASRRAPEAPAPQQLAGQQPAGAQSVTVSARPLEAPAAVTTTTSGGAMATAARTFTQRRDTTLQAQREAAARQAAELRRRQGAQPQRAAQRPAQAGPQPQAPAATSAQQPPVRTANR